MEIREVSVEEALRWEGEMGVVGMLSSRTPSTALAACEGERIVGAATMSGSWIPGVVVDPAFRRRGIGKALFLEAFRRLKTAGVAVVRVQGCSQGGWALINFLPEDVQGGLNVKEDAW